MPYAMKEIRAQKLERMRILLGAIKEHPRILGDLKNLLKDVHRQNIHNYLTELKGLGLIFYEGGKYYATGTKKKVYESKHDYNLALKHSKMLVLSSDYDQKFDAMSPVRAVDFVAFDMDPKLGLEVSNEIKLFRQHLRTGYHDVYSLLEEYREKMVEVGYADRSGFSKLYPLGEEPNLPEELVNLQKRLIGEIYFIVGRVEHGIPLQGYCDSCPDRVLTIKG